MIDHEIAVLRDSIREAHAVEQMLDRGYVYLPSELAKQTRSLMEWFEKLATDQSEINKWIVTDPREINYIEDPDEVDIGILAKKRDGGNRQADEIESRHEVEDRLKRDLNKTTIHFAPRLLFHLRSNGASIEKYREYLTGLERLHRGAYALAYAFVQELDVTFRGSPFTKRFEAAEFFHKTRQVRYFKQFGFHRDRNGLSIQSGSNLKGLGIKDRSGKMVHADVTNPETVCIFPGKKLSALLALEELGELDATVHGGMETDGLFARQSIIFFGHFFLTEQEWRWDEVRTKSNPNYRLSQAELFEAFAKAA
jgi:hypothetical protein